MLKLACTTAFVAVISTAAFAQGTTHHTIPANSFTVTDWYKQTVYDPKDAKIGQIMDVLVDKSGKVTSFIVGVGHPGAGEKDVSVPFDAVRITTKDNNKWYLVMNTTKDEMKSASGFTYDKDSTTWRPTRSNAYSQLLFGGIQQANSEPHRGEYNGRTSRDWCCQDHGRQS